MYKVDDTKKASILVLFDPSINEIGYRVYETYNISIPLVERILQDYVQVEMINLEAFEQNKESIKSYLIYVLAKFGISALNIKLETQESKKEVEDEKTQEVVQTKETLSKPSF